MVEKIKEEVSKAGIKILGLIPYDEIVTEAQIKIKSVVEYEPKSKVAKEIMKVKNIINKEIENN